MSDQLTPQRAVRLLRAKASELESMVANDTRDESADLDQVLDRLKSWRDRDLNYLAADIALVATLLADHIERTGA